MPAPRITNAVLQAKVDNVNRLLGFDPDGGANGGYNCPGFVILRSAYGSTGVSAYSGAHGGQRDLSGLGTKRETAIFLDGMREALLATTREA